MYNNEYTVVDCCIMVISISFISKFIRWIFKFASLNSFRSTFSDNLEYAVPAENGLSPKTTVGDSGGGEIEKDVIQDALRLRNV